MLFLVVFVAACNSTENTNNGDDSNKIQLQKYNFKLALFQYANSCGDALMTSIKGTVQPFEWWFLRHISALLIEKTN